MVATKTAVLAFNGRADRIDGRDGEAVIVDYKTGKAPSAAAVREGYSQQLGLLGLIAERAGFEKVEGRPLAFEYWSLASKKGELGFRDSPVGGKNPLIAAEDFTERAEAMLRDAANRWLLGDEAFTAKLHPDYAPYPDYDQLMRLDEWYGRQPGGGA